MESATVTSSSPEYNKDELLAPEFLNKEFFRKVLQIDENDEEIQIKDLKIVPGTKPGDHFASIIFKAIISYTCNGQEVTERSLIVKTMPILDGLKKDVLEEMPVFEREIAIYAKVLPEMKRIMDSVGDNEKIAPSLIYHSSDPPVIILEDISQKGFKMHGKLFDFENVTKIVKKMAKFHALSMYINENKSEKDFNLPDYDGVYINEKSIDKMRVFFDGMSVLKDYVKNWPGYEEIAEKVAKIPPKFLQKLLKIYKANPEPGLNVLCHGDIQINNMMVLKNGQDIEEIIFLDFQLSFWASPAIDLLYVLYVTGTADVRQRKDEVLLLYHRTLTDYLQRIGFHQEGPSLQDLHIDMLKLGQIEILLGLCFLPMFYIDKSQVDMNAFAEPTAQAIEKFYRAFYTNPKFTVVLKDILKSLWYRGILD